jgi:hypothetical protein
VTLRGWGSNGVLRESPLRRLEERDHQSLVLPVITELREGEKLRERFCFKVSVVFIFLFTLVLTE